MGKSEVLQLPEKWHVHCTEAVQHNSTSEIVTNTVLLVILLIWLTATVTNIENIYQPSRKGMLEKVPLQLTSLSMQICPVKGVKHRADAFYSRRQQKCKELKIISQASKSNMTSSLKMLRKKEKDNVWTQESQLENRGDPKLILDGPYKRRMQKNSTTSAMEDYLCKVRSGLSTKCQKTSTNDS